MRFFEAKAYGLHDTSNPLFPRQREVARRWWPWLCLLMFISLGVGGLAALIYGPYLSIRTVEIFGTTTLHPEDLSLKVREGLSQKNFLILPNSHQWFFNTQRAEQTLLDNFPLKSAEVIKDGATVRVTVAEDIFLVALHAGDEVYLLDPSGKVLRVAEPAEKAAVLLKIGAVEAPADGQELAPLHNDMPVIRDKMETVRSTDEQLLDSEKIDNLIKFSEGLHKLGITSKEFVSDDLKLDWFAVTSDKDYLLLFDATKDVDEQLEVLKAIMDQFLVNDEKPGYIDLRFGTRVYVR